MIARPVPECLEWMRMDRFAPPSCFAPAQLLTHGEGARRVTQSRVQHGRTGGRQRMMLRRGLGGLHGQCAEAAAGECRPHAGGRRTGGGHAWGWARSRSDAFVAAIRSCADRATRAMSRTARREARWVRACRPGHAHARRVRTFLGPCENVPFRPEDPEEAEPLDGL